ncbi:hypothetical protein K438DRAFT_1970087 [Mycena galopus ATCC 62051]|nr:hypothetical protein K438DRAFT_1970087 [Mycena galopus ATCC 62051]
MALAGKAAGRDVRMWFSPTAGAGALRMLVEAFSACGLGVSVATDGTLYKTERIREVAFARLALSLSSAVSFILSLRRRPVLSSPSPLSPHTGTTPTPRHPRVSDARGGSLSSLSPELVYAPGGSMSQLDFGYTAQMQSGGRVGYPYQDS